MLKSNKNLHDGKIVVKLKKYEFIYQQIFSNLFSTQFEWKKSYFADKKQFKHSQIYVGSFSLSCVINYDLQMFVSSDVL